MDVCEVIQQRLKELGLEQRDLAAAAQVTESYISQLLTRRKAPPAANRTDIYEKMNTLLKLPKGQLSALVEEQHREEWKKKLADTPKPLYHEVRELVIQKCRHDKQKEVRDIFEKQAFGELERMVTQKLLDVTKRIARNELENERWLRSVAKLRKQSYEEARTIILEFLDTDVFNLSAEHCNAFLAPLLESWDIDLPTFGIKVVLNRLLSPIHEVEFQFMERVGDGQAEVEQGFQEFLELAGFERRRDRGRIGIVARPAIQVAAAHCGLLLPRTAEPARSSELFRRFPSPTAQARRHGQRREAQAN